MTDTTRTFTGRTRRSIRGRHVRRRAFTILELLIVIGILLAIGGIVLVNLIGVQEESEVGVTKVQMQGIADQLDAFRLSMKRFPTEDEGIAVLWSSSNLEDEEEAGNWRQFMPKPVPNDQWGNAWVYRNPSDLEGQPYDLISIGPDGEEDTEDDLSIHDGILDEDGELRDDFSDFATSSDGAG